MTNPLIIIDFETGGLDPSKHAATEIAMCCITTSDCKEIGRYSSLIAPYIKEYDQKALDFTGTTMAKLQSQGKPIKVVVEEVEQALKSWYQITTNSFTKKPILVGHNITFDLGFLQALFTDSGKKDVLAKYVSGGTHNAGKWSPDYIDTINLAKLTLGGDPNFNSYKLGLVASRMGVDLIDAHSAMNDVLATKELVIKFINRLRNEGDESGGGKSIRVRNEFKLHFNF